MRIRYACLPCLVNQAVRTAELTNAPDRDGLFRAFFRDLSELDFNRTNPEVIGAMYRRLKAHTCCKDPYQETRRRCNEFFRGHSARFEALIDQSKNPFEKAIKYAIAGNLVDFSPIHEITIDEVMETFDKVDALPLYLNDSESLKYELSRAKTLLYLGDNCGEICLDMILIRKIRALNPNLKIFFGVRGVPVVNDNTEDDAYSIGMNALATIISNGDDSLGTILPRCSEEFLNVYRSSDIVIAKGQANYESLSEEVNKAIYFLLMTKCAVIADDLGVPEKSMICKRHLL